MEALHRLLLVPMSFTAPLRRIAPWRNTYLAPIYYPNRTMEQRHSGKRVEREKRQLYPHETACLSCPDDLCSFTVFSSGAGSVSSYGMPRSVSLSHGFPAANSPCKTIHPSHPPLAHTHTQHTKKKKKETPEGFHSSMYSPSRRHPGVLLRT